jgi:hypothetical protein
MVALHRRWVAPLFAVVLMAGQAWAEEPPEAASAQGPCPAGRHRRTAHQVVDDFHAALAAGNVHKAVVCNYAQNAKVITAGGVFTGHAAVEAGLAGFGALFGSTFPTVLVDEATRDVVFMVYTLITPFASIPDGADTFVVTDGLIRTQTVHASIVFGAPAP